ncbi:hypothetical protein MC7420_1353 [Coleofasciculus chthonoplastes PCC 7420]|uniref:Uncharacterized protein n=1 Tax=Coleofasciculus chthonoplastes PCC 7420 TaxID=118168 RepID=B4VR84_9CYAN|nr:hypothetical protein MC7420_1353 [Coleofasciculus chthonoplastes PCC 7420]
MDSLCFPLFATAIKIAATQTKSAYADSIITGVGTRIE